MLSRIADSLFWMSRYIERAEDTARLLDVNYHMMLDPDAGGAFMRLRWEPVIAISGDQTRFAEHYGYPDARNVFEFLAFREDNPNSIVSCIRMLRENARTIRDRISREMWEDINGLHHLVLSFKPEDEMEVGPHRFCNAIKFGAHRFHGVADDTLPHDEGWQFLQAGRALERAEMTARIVDVEYHQLIENAALASGNHQWMAVLKSVAAYEMYRRYHSRIDPEKVAELLILHPQHPRSIRFNISALQQSLWAIRGTQPAIGPSEAERLTGEAHRVLTNNRIQDIFARGLHDFLAQLQDTCRSIGGHIEHSYFYNTVLE